MYQIVKKLRRYFYPFRHNTGQTYKNGKKYRDADMLTRDQNYKTTSFQLIVSVASRSFSISIYQILRMSVIYLSVRG